MKIKTATTFWERLRGLLGTDANQLNFDVLHLKPCTDIHTFGMRYPLDVAFLNCHNRVIGIRRRICPNRFCSAPFGTVSVLERPALRQAWFKKGDILPPASPNNHIRKNRYTFQKGIQP
jgi:uncharacterized membrane protein (UPF0127 family)